MHSRQEWPSDPSTVQLAAAFAAVYVIWGSTYLAIRFAIETMPPLLMASVRFLIAGTALYIWGRRRGAPRPTGAQWRAAAIVGGLLLLGGNGAVVVAEQWIPSGLAALLIAAVPLWIVLVDWLAGSGRRPTRRVAGGLFTGFLGVALLGGSPGVGAGGPMEVFGAVLLLLGGASWATGSIYSRRAPTPPRPRVWVGMQMLAGGALLLPASALAGEWARVDPSGVSARSALALLYLIVFGAIIGYSAYIWLLAATAPARVATYAYVNPVVALVLGWAVAGEPLTPRSLLAAAVIVGGVVVITTERGASGDAPPLRPAPVRDAA